MILSSHDDLSEQYLPHFNFDFDFDYHEGDNMDGQKEEEDGVFQTRIHHVVVPKDGINNSMEAEEICVICHMEVEHEDTVGTLGCGHEYHAGCIKQ
ncbi:hypothetical protein MTR67_044553 [Solanum verrucosum]|uniref:RING-type E3 ubiquitin transferase n=1 Tax=Solanum verrucosum TaxID=315347 RepID=A0AAF0ZVD4_SOLVR|nr:hypothetical protein MTR67_044553 [Solanum verrucosum]